jgi:hypothetical protein
MKIAICFSGQIRTGIKAAASIKHFLGELYSDCDFFMHTWDISQPKLWHRDSIKVRELGYNNCIISDGYGLIADINKSYDNKFRQITIENFDKWNTTFNVGYKNVSPLWYSWYKSISLKKMAEEQDNILYDFVVKLRPDVVFPARRSLRNEIDNIIMHGDNFYANGCDPKRIDDVLFISSSHIMNNASELVFNIPDKEWTNNIFAEYLKSINIKYINTHSTWYSILREEVPDKDVMNFNKCFNLDRDYHAPYNTDRLPVND